MKWRGWLLIGSAVLGVVLGLGYLSRQDGALMSVFSPLVLFSRVEGVVTLDGKPVAGAELVQTGSLKEENDLPPVTVRTGADGKFELAELTRGAGLTRLIPGELRILQRIDIRYDGRAYQAWRHTKAAGEPNSELEGRPLRLVCELTTAPDFEGTHFGICREAKD